MAFCLGGVRADGTYIGFSTDPINPFDSTATSRIPPFFAFGHERLDDQGRYYPTVEAKAVGGSERAIHYCRAHERSYSSPYAFRDARTNDWINPQSFQILSPGLRGGVLAGGNPGFPNGLQEAHFDMMSNFTSGTMQDTLP